MIVNILGTKKIGRVVYGFSYLFFMWLIYGNDVPLIAFS